MTLAPFICLDGIDGTGKSTQCRLLLDWLARRGLKAIGCNDPGGTLLGDHLRQLLLQSRADITPRAEALLFMASRAELVARIVRPALEAGTIVVSDRFVTANVVYQGHAGGLSPEELWQVGDFSTGKLRPNRVIILDLPVDQAVARRGRAADRLESRGVEYLERVRAGFLKEATTHSDWMTVIDASGDIDTIHRAIAAECEKVLVERGKV
jgi:dTMP kinase